MIETELILILYQITLKYYKDPKRNIKANFAKTTKTTYSFPTVYHIS